MFKLLPLLLLLLLVSSESNGQYQLKFVQFITRHGARTPLNILPKEDFGTVWNCIESQLLQRDDVGGPSVKVDRMHRQIYLTDKGVLKGNCTTGQLTAVGCKQHTLIGRELKSRYIDTGFLPPYFSSKAVWIRSTDVPRTKESAQCLLLGFYPPYNADLADLDVIDIHMMEANRETMYGLSSLCPNLDYQVSQARKTQTYLDYVASLAPLRRHLCEISGIPESAFPSFNLFYDGVMCRIAEGLPLPPGITQADVLALTDVQSRLFDLEYCTDTVNRLGLGPFAGEVLANIDAKMKGQLEPAFMLFSGHDSTVGPLFYSSGVWNKRFPDFASTLAVELYTNSTGAPFVRLLLSGKEVVPAPCASAMCEYVIWRKFVSRIVPKDRAAECAVPKGAEAPLPKCRK